MPKRKNLSDDDKAVWKHVTKQIIPIAPRKIMEPPETLVQPRPKPAPASHAPIAPFEIGSQATKSKTSIPSFRTGLEKTSPNMDKKNFQRLIKGQKQIDSTLDLHGLTADQARQRLSLVIPRASASGQRLLLVITGKGNKSHVDEFNRPRSGVLRQSLPDWLRGPALSPYILQVSQAQQRHGGAGAFYVYLRRKR